VEVVVIVVDILKEFAWWLELVFVDEMCFILDSDVSHWCRWHSQEGKREKRRE
jgi:hypothetical protein